MRTPIILATLAVAHSSLAAPIGAYDSPVFNSPNPADDARSPRIPPSPLPEAASPSLRASPALRTAGRRRSIPHFKRIVNPRLSALSAPGEISQGSGLGMGLGIPSITDTVAGSPSRIFDSLPMEQVGDVVNSPTEELRGALLDAPLLVAPDALLPVAPDGTVPQTPNVKPAVPVPITDDEFIKLLTDNDHIGSAEAIAAVYQDGRVDPYALIELLKAAKAPAPIRGTAGSLPVRRQAPDIKEQVERLLGTPPTRDQHNSPLAYALGVTPTLPVARPSASTPTEMIDVSAVPRPPPTSPSVVAYSVPIAHDDPRSPSAISLPSLDAPFSLENDSGEPFAAAMLSPSWGWSETTGFNGPVPTFASPPTPSLMGVRDFKPTVPTGKLTSKELPPLLAPPKEKLGFGAAR